MALPIQAWMTRKEVLEKETQWHGISATYESVSQQYSCLAQITQAQHPGVLHLGGRDSFFCFCPNPQPNGDTQYNITLQN